jgi:hypothetical protein
MWEGVLQTRCEGLNHAPLFSRLRLPEHGLRWLCAQGRRHQGRRATQETHLFLFLLLLHDAEKNARAMAQKKQYLEEAK